MVYQNVAARQSIDIEDDGHLSLIIQVRQIRKQLAPEYHMKQNNGHAKQIKWRGRVVLKSVISLCDLIK